MFLGSYPIIWRRATRPSKPSAARRRHSAGPRRAALPTRTVPTLRKVREGWHTQSGHSQPRLAIALAFLVLAIPASLRALPAPPTAQHPVRMVQQWIPMADGVRLSATLYMPDSAKPDEKFPALLEYLPYRKDDATAARDYPIHAWFAAHADYHRLITAGAGDALQRQLQAFADRTIRYIRIYQLSDPNSWQAAGDVEHVQILEALIAGDEPGALAGMAHHLERTALRALTDCAPEYVPVAVPHAVALVEREPSAAFRLTGTH